MPDIVQLEGKDIPGALTILCHALLLRLGGQQSFTIDELAQVVYEYGGIRIVNDTEHGLVTLTLRTHEGETFHIGVG